MPRALRIQGVPSPDGDHINIYPFSVRNFDAELRVPDIGTPGTFANVGGELGWLCLADGLLSGHFCRHRYYRSGIIIAGTYDIGAGPVSYVFDREQTRDIVTTGGSVDERFLAHGRCDYLNVPLEPATNCAGEAFIFFSYYDDGELMVPANTPIPQLTLFDENGESPGDYLYPRVGYSRTWDKWYLRIAGQAGFPFLGNLMAQISYSDGMGGPTYLAGWVPECMSIPIGSILLGTANLVTSSLGNVPGKLYGPDYGPALTFSMDTFSFTMDQPTSDGFFPHAKLDTTAPIYDIDSGLELITPVPMIQD